MTRPLSLSTLRLIPRIAACLILLTVAASAQTNATWKLQSPLPTGSSLQSVDMVSATEAWAVGYGGIIIHTTDGGVTWTQQTSGITDPLYVVRFVDSLHGWIGSNNAVLYTTNGGLTWTKNSSVLGSVTSLGFADINNGFAAEGVSIVYRTRDGGKTWTTVSLPIAVSNVRFFDSSNGVASGSGVLHTSDGGNTWTLQPGSTIGGFFTDPSNGWNVLNAGAQHTTDGGTNWSNQSLPANSWIYGRYFSDSLNGWAVGAQMDIVHTADGGSTWTTQKGGLNSGVDNTWSFWDVHFANTLQGIAVGDSGVLYTTGDGGTTWTNRESGSGTETLSMSATDSSHLWAGNIFGEVLRTTDGGQKWIRGNLGVSYLVYGISFADNLNGWAVASDAQAGAGLIFHSTDGGVTWTQQTARRQLYAVKALSSTSVVAVGGDSFGPVEVRSTDGGATWIENDTVPSGVLYGLYFLNSTTGWAVGQFATIIKTTDGGVTWSNQFSGVDSSIPLLAVSFADANNGWVVGDGAALVHTTNGGATWKPQTVPVFNNYISVAAVSPTVAWIGGVDTIARTLDSGATWTTEAVAASPTSYSALYFLDADNGWAGGFSGISRRTGTAAVFTSLTLSPSTLVSGSSSTGTVTLASPAPTGGAVVALSSNNAAATVPASVTVPAGTTQATFTVTTKPLFQVTQVTITAAYNSGSISSVLTLNPMSVQTFTVKPTTVKGGTSSVGTVTINGPAPATGVKIKLTSSNPAVATVPPSVRVPSGATSVSFTVTTKTVTSNQVVSLIAKGGPSAASANLTVTP